ncbi:hypothetical protein Vadar_015935 [Vaccinium darrowii]|uniref:Uncharacterized protein n=1 Tax=Vaccinium darrowii TaxID=229202 RepID=A0ACB7ZCH9_9ERIC|nr:hypothetical protein Vadar_015935 [Vaccinium darrowii]
MDSQGSLPSHTTKKSKGKQPTEGKEKQQRRLWSVKEKEALLGCMLDCLCDKYKADNGFKAGYFVLVEKELQKALPGTTLKTQPNIESKVKNWKKKYGVIADTIKLSGFSWNYGTKSIEVDNESVWEAYEKDRATDDFAEDPAEIQDVDVDDDYEDEPVEVVLPPMDDNLYTPLFANGEPVFPSESAHTTFDQSQCSASANPTTPTSNAVPKPPKKKAKIDAREAAMHEALGNFCNQSNEVLVKLVDAVSFDKDLTARRTGVFNDLMKLDLDMDDRVIVNDKICSKDERVLQFYGIPDQVKQQWVMRILEGKLYGNT